MSEHDIQNTIVELIQYRGGIVTRTNSGSAVFKRDGVIQVIRGAEKGTSDLIALYRGVYLAIEVKFGKGKPTPEQIAFLESVAKAGGVGLLAYDSEFIDRTMNMIDKYELIEISAMFKLVSDNWKPNRLFVSEAE